MQIDCIATCNLGTRQAMHVQSLSYWAPANIGPYSQLVDVRFYPLSLDWEIHLFSRTN